MGRFRLPDKKEVINMAKYIIRLVSFLVILFISVPFAVSADSEKSYSLPLVRAVTLVMPDGSSLSVSEEELLCGTAAAYLPEEDSEEVLKAFCIILRTPELINDGILYLSPDERSRLFGAQCDEKEGFYADIAMSVRGEDLILPENTDFSLNDFTAASDCFSGSYIDILSALFPGGSLVREIH